MAGAREDGSKPNLSSPFAFPSQAWGNSLPLSFSPPRRSSSLVDRPASFADQRLILIGCNDQSNPHSLMFPSGVGPAVPERSISVEPLHSISMMRRLDIDLSYTGPMGGKFPVNKHLTRVKGDNAPGIQADDVFISTYVKGAGDYPTIACSFPNLSGLVTDLKVPDTSFSLNNISARFTGMKFDCYLAIIPYIERMSLEAASFVKSCLPSNGPLVSYHLGSLLGFVTFMFDINSFELPAINVRVCDGFRFLHLDETETIDVKKFIAILMSVDGFVGAGQKTINPVDMINVAASVGAVTIASNDASTTYRDALNACVKVSLQLSAEDIEIISKERLVRCAPSVPYSGDHALMAAYRMIIRQDFISVFNPAETNSRTFILGATAREYKLYANNVKVYFQLANREGKDMDRLVLTFLEDLKRTKAKKLRNKTKMGVTLERDAEQLVTIDEMLKMWRNERKIPQRFIVWDESRDLVDKALVPEIVKPTTARTVVNGNNNDEFGEMPELEDEHGNIIPRDNPLRRQERKSVMSSIRNVLGGTVRMLLPKFDNRSPNRASFEVIVFEDVGYNFTELDWYKLFKNTGASVAYGYMCLPWELIFPDIVSPPGYKFRVDEEYSELAYHGYSNGYSHLTEAWATLMQAPAMVFDDMVIGVEHLSRVGPMVCIKLYRCTGPERVVRCLSLPQFLRSITILNVRASMRKLSGKLDMTNLVYFPVRLEEFEHAINFAMDVARESLSFRSVLVFIRRKTSGISLVSKEYTRAWNVPTGLVPEMALVVYLCTIYYLTKMEGAEFKITGRKFNPIVALMFQHCKSVCGGFRNILDFLTIHNNFDEILVKELDNEVWQQIKSMARKSFKKQPRVFVGNDPEDYLDCDEDFGELSDVNLQECDFCDQLKFCVGDQKFFCNRNKTETFMHDFGLTDAELKTFRFRLSNVDDDSVGIKTVKTEALAKVPVATFSTSVQVQYICGPPGTGKSHAIRAMARQGDLVIGPFARLKDDYTNFVHPITGRKTSLKFLTQHTAMAALNHDRVFVDEYTAFPYECLAVILFNCGASEVILVGDHRQTAIINEVEGISIESKIDLKNLREHELIKNYRNPSDVVVLLNTCYGYNMEATNNRLGYKFDVINNFKNYLEYTPLFFTHASARRMGITSETSKKVTVRANQGATYTNVVLVVRNEDESIFNMPSMAIVALSRHKEICVILFEDGVSASFMGHLRSTLPRSKDDEDRNRRRRDDDDDDDDQGPNGGDGRQLIRNDRFNNARAGGDKVHLVDAGTDLRIGRQQPLLVQTSRATGFVLPEPDKSLLVYHEHLDIDLPSKNLCLLTTISEITGISIDTIWREFKGLFSSRIYETIEQEGLSLFHCEYYCKYRNFRISIVKDNGERVVCGNTGPFVGMMSFRLPTSNEEVNMGHFSPQLGTQGVSQGPSIGTVVSTTQQLGTNTTPTQVQEMVVPPPPTTNIPVVSATTTSSVPIDVQNIVLERVSEPQPIQPQGVNTATTQAPSAIPTSSSDTSSNTSQSSSSFWQTGMPREVVSPSRLRTNVSTAMGSQQGVFAPSPIIMRRWGSLSSSENNDGPGVLPPPFVTQSPLGTNHTTGPGERVSLPATVATTNVGQSDTNTPSVPPATLSSPSLVHVGPTNTAPIVSVTVPNSGRNVNQTRAHMGLDPLDSDSKGKNIVDDFDISWASDVIQAELDLLPSTSSNPFNVTVNRSTVEIPDPVSVRQRVADIEGVVDAQLDTSQIVLFNQDDDDGARSSVPPSSPTMGRDSLSDSRRDLFGHRRSVGDIVSESDDGDEDTLLTGNLDAERAVNVMKAKYPDFDVGTLILDIQRMEINVILLTNNPDFMTHDVDDTMADYLDLRTKLLLYKWFLKTYKRYVISFSTITEETCSQSDHDNDEDDDANDGSGTGQQGALSAPPGGQSKRHRLSRSLSRLSSSFRRPFTGSRRHTTSQDDVDLDKDINPTSTQQDNRDVVRFSRHVPEWRGGASIVDQSFERPDVTEPRDAPPEPLVGAERRFLDMARLFTEPVKVDVFLTEKLEQLNHVYLSLPPTAYDAYKMLVEEFATEDEHDFQLTNEETLGYVDDTFDNGFFDTRVLENINQRGHLKPNKVEAWSLLAVAPGVTYFKSNINQTMACLQSRYLTKALNCSFTHESVNKAYEIADLFFTEHMEFNLDIFNEEDVWRTTLESEHSMKIKNYEKQTDFSMGIDPVVRFNMKDIFKPFKNKIDLFKAGQGISAWSKENQTIFQTPFRLVNKHFINCLKPHVVYDNGIDETTLMNRINALFLSLPYVCQNGVIDATACDSGQNQFTQLIERRILERLGLSDEFLDWYYMLREKYILKGSGVTATITGIKTSGEPATLLNNTILMASLMNYLIRGQGPCVLVIKGDDGLKRQANLVYHDELKLQLEKFLKMGFKVDIDVPITFCGYFLYDKFLMPDIVRKVIKILGHKFRDYEHFTEYQESLRDWILNVNRLGVMNVCMVTTKAYSLPGTQAEDLFDSIVSLSHINSNQFYATFKRRTYQWDDVSTETNKWSQRTVWYSGYN